jgi:hypothetical protein
MALSFVEATEQGHDAYAALAHGTLITNFTYAMQETPDVFQDMVYGFRDPLIAQIMLEGNIGKGATSSDQNRWYEAGRIQNSYERTVDWDTVPPAAGQTGVLQFPAGDEFDIRQDQTILLSALAADITGASDLMEQFFVESVDTAAKTANVRSYEGASSAFVVAATAVNEVMSVSHLASDYKQGSGVADESVTHTGIWRSNNPIIVKDYIKYDRSKLQQMVFFTDDLKRYYIDTRALDKRMDIQQIMAGVFGVQAETGEHATAGYAGTESVIDAVTNRGNTCSGTWAAKSDLDNYVKTLNSVKGSKTNALMLDLNSALTLDQALAGVSPHGDAATFDYGAFGEDVDFRRLGFNGVSIKGWETLYKHWDILDDTTYFGAHGANTNKVTGLSIPKGQVELASGGSMNYLSYLYRDGMSEQVGKDGGVFGLGHNDVAEISKTIEFTPRTVSAKDFIVFK